MSQPALGLLLQRLREARGLSLRELAQLAGVDHAYIYRLESGSKESPSEEVLSKMIKGLKPGKRETEIMQYLAEHPDTDPSLVTHVLEDPTVTYQVFAAAAAAAFRGARLDYARLIERVRRILAEENGD